MYKKAIRAKLRFKSAVGNLTTEQLWELTMVQLKDVVKTCHNDLKKFNTEDDLAFLDEATSKKEDDLKAMAELRFNVAKDVFEIRKQEADNATADAAKRREQQKILELIAKKQDAALENLSIEELTKKLEELKNGK